MKGIPLLALLALCALGVFLAAGLPADGADRPISAAQEKLRKADELYRQGKQAIIAGNYSQANEYFSSAERVLVGEDEQPREQLGYPPDFFYNLGLERLRRGEFKLAEEAFLKTLSINPADSEACYNLGVLYENYLNQVAQAVDYYQRYLDLDPDGADAAAVKSWIAAIKAQDTRPWTTSN